MTHEELTQENALLHATIRKRNEELIAARKCTEELTLQVVHGNIIIGAFCQLQAILKEKESHE